MKIKTQRSKDFGIFNQAFFIKTNLEATLKKGLKKQTKWITFKYVQNISYTMKGGGKYFNISNNGTVSVDSEPDFEKKNEFEVSIFQNVYWKMTQTIMAAQLFRQSYTFNTNTLVYIGSSQSELCD